MSCKLGGKIPATENKAWRSEQKMMKDIVENHNGKESPQAKFEMKSLRNHAHSTNENNLTSVKIERMILRDHFLAGPNFVWFYRSILSPLIVCHCTSIYTINIFGIIR